MTQSRGCAAVRGRLGSASLVVSVALLLAANASATDRQRVRVKATAYCGCDRCTHGLGVTKAGTTPVEGFTIAADPSVFPIGTILMVDGREMMVHDIGSAVRGLHIDVYHEGHRDAVRWGVRHITVEVIHRGGDR